MMMSCKQMTYLISQQLDRKLNTSERIELRLHTMMCTDCRNFDDNVAFLRKVSLRATGERDDM